MPKLASVRWISIAEALERATGGSVLDVFGAIDLIEEGLGRGKLRARATKIELVDGRQGPSASRALGQLEADAEGFFQVPPPLLASGNFSEDIFENLKFHREIVFESPQMSASFDGLQVHLRDFNKLITDSLAWDVSGVMKGRPRSEHAWLQFIITAVELERDGLLTEGNFPDSRTLKKAFAEELQVSGSDETELDERTYGPYVDGLWTLMVRGYKP